MNNAKRDWENAFWERFEHKKLCSEGCEGDDIVTPDDILAFIRQVEDEARKEERHAFVTFALANQYPLPFNEDERWRSGWNEAMEKVERTYSRLQSQTKETNR